jgi:hypothetical protein
VTTWATWRAWLLPALRDADEAELIADLISGVAQLWPGERSAMVTQVFEALDGPSLHVWLAGGELDDILALKPGIEAWARARGCRWVTIEGRRGWERLLKAGGFERVGDELRKRL